MSDKWTEQSQGCSLKARIKVNEAYSKVRETVAKIQHGKCKGVGHWEELSLHDKYGWLDEADEILSYNDGEYAIAIVEVDGELPLIPEFQYDEEEYRPYLKRGAINYSKMLSGYTHKVIHVAQEKEE